MKKSIASVVGTSVLCICTPAAAQSSVTLYGVAEGNLRLDHTNIGTLRSIDSGGETGNRWGLRGKEELGDGLAAIFNFEQGFDLSDNSVSQGNVGAGASAGFGGSSTAPHGSTGSRLFSRIATVGISGPFGYLKFGRDYNPLHLTQALADPFAAGSIAEAANVFVNNTIRNDNAVYYDTPTVAGFMASGVVQLGESTTDNAFPAATGQSKHGNDRYGAGLRYTNGPLFASVGTEQIRSNLDVYRVQSSDAAVSYDFGLVKLAAIYWQTKDTNRNAIAALGSTLSVNERSYYLGATIPFGAWTFLGGYGKLHDHSRSNLSAVDLGKPAADYLGAMVRYNFSKQVAVYLCYARMNLDKGNLGQSFQGFRGFSDASNVGLYTVANLNGPAGANVNPYSIQMGIRKSF